MSFTSGCGDAIIITEGNERKNFKVLDIDKEGRKISLSIAK